MEYGYSTYILIPGSSKLNVFKVKNKVPKTKIWFNTFVIK